MKVEDAKKELLVVHRNSPIGREYDHFYSVSSVNRLIEKLVSRINELERDIAKKTKAQDFIKAQVDNPDSPLKQLDGMMVIKPKVTQGELFN